MYLLKTHPHTLNVATHTHTHTHTHPTDTYGGVGRQLDASTCGKSFKAMLLEFAISTKLGQLHWTSNCYNYVLVLPLLPTFIPQLMWFSQSCCEGRSNSACVQSEWLFSYDIHLSLFLALFSIEITWFGSHFVRQGVGYVHNEPFLSILASGCYGIDESGDVRRFSGIFARKKCLPRTTFCSIFFI